MGSQPTDTEAARILEAKTKGLSLRQIASQEGLTVHKVRETVKAPVILREIAQHRTKYAVTSYENACRITDLVSQAIQKIKVEDILGDSRFLRDLAWVAKSQFDQSNAILGSLIKSAETSGDQELEEAKKLLAAKILKREAEALSSPTVEAEGFTDTDPVSPDADLPPSA